MKTISMDSLTGNMTKLSHIQSILDINLLNNPSSCRQQQHQSTKFSQNLMNIKPATTQTTKRHQSENDSDNKVMKSPKQNDIKSKLNLQSKFSKNSYLTGLTLEGTQQFSNLYQEAENQHYEFAMARNIQHLTDQISNKNKENESLKDEIAALKKQIQLQANVQKGDPAQILKLQQEIKELTRQNQMNSELVQEKELKLQQLQIKVDEFNNQQQQQNNENNIMNEQMKADYELKIQSYQQQLEQQINEIKNLESTFQNSKQDFERLQQQMQLKDSELQRLQEQFSEQMSNMEKELAEKNQVVNDSFQMIKKLEYQIQDLKGKIRICLRIRPAVSNSKIAFTYPDRLNYKKQLIYRTQGQKSADGRDRNQDVAIDFDRVFSTSEGQQDVFLEFQPLVAQIFEGHKICLFAYGQSGSGKTHTQYGNSENPGVMPSSLEYIFKQLEILSNQSPNSVMGVSAGAPSLRGSGYKVEVQFYEIYNDKLHDLLADQNTKSLASSSIEQAQYKAPECKVSIIKDQVKIVGLNTIEIKSIEDANALISVSQQRRRTSSTVLNDTSSRSHAVFTIHLTQVVDGATVTGSLTICDLAGSEQLQNTNVDPQRKQESIFINQSLSSLGKVFNSLRSNDGHIPYRDCTLTKVLQEYFQGQNKVLMVVCLNEEADNYQETVNSINFAARSKGVSMKK